MNRTIRLLIAIAAMSVQISAYAQGFTPTAEQIQQFKSMSPAQQQQMAEAAGIDLNALVNSSQESKQPVLTDGGKTPEVKTSEKNKES